MTRPACTAERGRPPAGDSGRGGRPRVPGFGCGRPPGHQPARCNHPRRPPPGDRRRAWLRRPPARTQGARHRVGGCDGWRRPPRGIRDPRRDPQRDRAGVEGRRAPGLDVGAAARPGMGVRPRHGAAPGDRRRQSGGRGRGGDHDERAARPPDAGGLPRRRVVRRGDAGRPRGVRGGAEAQRGRPVVTRRGWALAILAAWILSLGWLIKRTYFRSTGQRLAESALAVPPGAVFYRITVGAQQIGFASTTIDTLQDTVRVEDVLVVDVPALGRLHRTTARSQALLNRGLRLILSAGEDSQLTWARFTRPVVLPSLLPLRLAFGGELKTGRTSALRVFDPALLAERDVAVTIAAESTLVVPDSADYDSTAMGWVAVHFDTVRAFRLDQRSEGLAASMWVDAQGHIVRATSPTGVTLDRTAFELAYENFRRRDTARVARSSAQPDRGGIVPITAIAAGVRNRSGAAAALRVRLTGEAVHGIDLTSDRQRLTGDTLTVRPDRPAALRAAYR